MSPLQIRPARTSDVAKIVSMLRTIHSEHLAWDAARWTTSTPPHLSYGAWVEQLVHDAGRDGVALVAELDEVTAGYLLAEVEPESTRHWSPRAVYIHDVFVDAPHRRRGVADALMGALIEWGAKTHPSLQVRLMTAAQNEAARRFFARHGFRPCVVEMIRSSTP
jgi:GNAT superfamily N-acetyltransferase